MSPSATGIRGFGKLGLMKLARVREGLPGWKNVLLALLSAVLLVLAFPDFDLWWMAWFALVPLMWAPEREKESISRATIVGWIFGTAFFFGSCWWLTFAPITYAGFPPVVAYLLLFFAAAGAGIFPGIFAGVLAYLLRRFGSVAMLAAPFMWVATEFARYWITGNNWNGLGYSQAFGGYFLRSASIGGAELVSFILGVLNVVAYFVSVILLQVSGLGAKVLGSELKRENRPPGSFEFDDPGFSSKWKLLLTSIVLLSSIIAASRLLTNATVPENVQIRDEGFRSVVAIQPNVPMSGLTYEKWQALRRRHVKLAESALAGIKYPNGFHLRSTVVIFPESPMNFMYETDAETRAFIDGFAKRNGVSVIFNSAEPDGEKAFFNSAVMVGPQGGEIAQYDKIYLLPFGESVPAPLRAIVPAFVGSFSYGSEYDLLPLGDAKGGVMICFESHFGELSREYVRHGADVLIEMTNDGYLGPTPVLRQHLANAVFRAVETNRPVLRVTNVGITAYINERGQVIDPAPSYTEDTRVWSVAKSDGSQTLYVRWGDWFAWVCVVVTMGLLLLGIGRRRMVANGDQH